MMELSGWKCVDCDFTQFLEHGVLVIFCPNCKKKLAQDLS